MTINYDYINDNDDTTQTSANITNKNNVIEIIIALLKTMT